MLRKLSCNNSSCCDCCRFRKFVSESSEWFYFFRQNLYMLRVLPAQANLFCSKSRVWRDTRVILLNQNSEVSIHATCKNLTCGKTGLIRG